MFIHLFQKTLSERTTTGSCRTEIAQLKGTVVSIWTNHMIRHRRSSLDGACIMETYFLLIFTTQISFQSCNRRSTVDIHRSPRQHFLKQVHIRYDEGRTLKTSASLSQSSWRNFDPNQLLCYQILVFNFPSDAVAQFLKKQT